MITGLRATPSLGGATSATNLLSSLRAVLRPVDSAPTSIVGSLARMDAAPAPSLGGGVMLSGPVALVPTTSAPVLRSGQIAAAPSVGSNGANAPAVATGVSSPTTAAPLSPAQFRPPTKTQAGYVSTAPKRAKSARQAAAAAPKVAPVVDVKTGTATQLPRGLVIAGIAAVALLLLGGR